MGLVGLVLDVGFAISPIVLLNAEKLEILTLSVYLCLSLCLSFLLVVLLTTEHPSYPSVILLP